MRIVSAESPSRRQPLIRRVDPRQRRHARLECLGLIVVTLVVSAGFWMTYRRQAITFGDVTRGLSDRSLVRLDGNPGQDLASKLTAFPSAAERTYAAMTIAQFVRERERLTHVGELASIVVPADVIRRDGRLTVLRERLSEQESLKARSTMVHLFTSADVASLKPFVVVRTPRQYTRHVLIAFGIFLLSFWIAHVVRRTAGTTGDAILLPSIQLLSGLSLLAMMSLRDPLRDTEAFGGVAWGVALGCAVLAAISAIDFENPRFRFATGLPLVGASGLAVLLLAFGSGPGVSGVKVNLWGVQPIEAIRILAVFALAAYFSRRWETVRELSDAPAAAPYLRLPRWSDVSPLFVIVGTLLTFFFLQHDLGPALVLGCLSLALYGVARGRAPLVIASLVVLVAGFAIGYELGVPATVARRVAIWLDPWNNGLLGGDQIAHGLWALATGGIRGLGLGAGDGQVVPAAHTDLIVAVLGEEIGLVGVIVIGLLYLLLIWRMLQIASRAPGDYTAFLSLGCALSLAVPALVIVGGVLGVFPLSGVVTPFLSFGKSSMVCNFAAVAIVLAIARRAGAVRPQIRRQVRTVGLVLATLAVILIADAVRIEAWQADTLAVRPTLVEQADGAARYQYNPRLLAAARRIPRGSIFDRNGLALATSDGAQATATLERLRKAGVGGEVCADAQRRCYPLGGRAFHLLGDWNTQTNWTASNVSFVERDQNATLQGFDDHPRTVDRVVHGSRQIVVMRDYRELLPLVRHKDDPNDPAVRSLLTRSRDITTSIDAVLQAHVADDLDRRVRGAGVERGAVAVIDPDTGELLASASVPYPKSEPRSDAAGPSLSSALLDRARYGLYPPGSTFKLITAAAALKANAGSSAFMCRRLDDGRVGAEIHGFRHAVRDDVTDKQPHGEVDLHRGLVVSCNAYFAQLAVRVGAQAIADAAAPTGIKVALDPVKEHLRGTLPYAGYGQGEVVASPLRMARVAGAIASDGVIRETSIVRPQPPVVAAALEATGVRWLTSEQASFLATSMRDVVQQGTGRALAESPIAIAGKTGTAELNQAPSHSWFVGFAPYATQGRRIAFAVIVENAGYGGRVAAPLAGDVVSAARAAGVIR